MMLDFNPKPAAPSMETNERWEHNALRVRMLRGQWQDDLESELARHVSRERRAAWGVSDMSSNVFKATSKSLSALYNEPPMIGVDASRQEMEGFLGDDGLIYKSGLWAMMQSFQMFTIGCREMFMRVDISDSNGLLFRPVTPDLIYCESSSGDPNQLRFLYELRLRHHPQSKEVIWTADVFDLRDMKNPKMKIMEVKNDGGFGENLTTEYLENEMDGDNYPFRFDDGSPVIPYSIYHAEITGKLFNSFENAEVVYGSLTAAALYTYWLHLTRDTGFPQRYIAGLQLAGLNIRDTDTAAKRAAISTDPASILVFTQDPDNVGQPMIGQFQPGGDPSSVLEAVIQYERKVAQMAGINPGDIERLSGDPRSGYAIAVSKESMREAQARYKPSFERGDQMTLSLAAMMANRFLGYNLPESGYKIRYARIGLSVEEKREQRADIKEKLATNLIAPIDAMMELYPDLNEEEAAEKIREIQRQKALFLI